MQARPEQRPRPSRPNNRARDPFRSLTALVRRQGDVALYRAGAERRTWSTILTMSGTCSRTMLRTTARTRSSTRLQGVPRRRDPGQRGDTLEARRRLDPAGVPSASAWPATRTPWSRTPSAIADRWEPLVGTDEPIDLAVEMGTLTMLITARVLFGGGPDRAPTTAGTTHRRGDPAIVSPQKEGFQAGKKEIMDLVGRLRRRADRRRR